MGRDRGYCRASFRDVKVTRLLCPRGSPFQAWPPIPGAPGPGPMGRAPAERQPPRRFASM
jgi:hypothetical protein